MSEPSTQEGAPGSTRREFAQRLALALATPLVTGLGGAEAREPEEPVRPAKAEGLAAMTLALSELVQVRYGQHLNGEHLAAVQHGIAAGLLMADRLSQCPLQNSDEPAFVFSADVR